MYELVAHGATGPAAAQHSFIAIQPLFTDLAMTRFDGKQHPLPLAAGFPDTHGTAV